MSLLQENKQDHKRQRLKLKDMIVQLPIASHTSHTLHLMLLILSLYTPFPLHSLYVCICRCIHHACIQIDSTDH